MFPPTRVLVAVDFSESSRIALDCGGRLARHCNAELHIVHVPPIPIGAATYTRGADVAGEIYDDLRTFATAIPPAINRHPRYHVVVGNTARVIRDVAQRESCDVVVVGTHGTSGDPVQAFGTTTEELLREAHTSVLVVPQTWRAALPESEDLTGMGPIIAGMDFTCPSIDATTAGARFAATLQTRLLVVHVVTPHETFAGSLDTDALSRQECAHARARLETLMVPLRAIASADAHVDRGGVATTLARIAGAEAGAVLVLGRPMHSRRFGPPGAVASRVLMHAHIPLLMHYPSST